MNSKRIIIVGMIALVLIILAAGFYFLFSSPKTSPGGAQGGTGTLPATGDQNQAGVNNPTASSTGSAAVIQIVSNEPILDYAVNTSGTVTAVEPTGKIVQVTNGQVTTLNALLIQNILDVAFSYNGTKVLVNFGDPANPQTSIFDIASKSWTPMATGWLSPAWSPSDYRIAYAIQGANGTEIFATLDASKSNSAPIPFTTLHAEDLSPAWLNKNQILLSTKPSAFAAGSSWLFDLQKKTLSPIAIESPGLEINWSNATIGSSTQLGLQFSTGQIELGGSLELVNTSGAAIQQIKFLTLPSKCAFATEPSTPTSYLYCGVPRNQSGLSYYHLPDDYNQMAFFTADDIYQINLTTGALNTLYSNPSQDFDINDAKVVNGSLFFVNRYDQKLYVISLATI